MRSHEKVAIVRRRIVQGCRLNGVIQRICGAQFAKGLVYNGSKDLRVDFKSTTSGQIERENCEDIVMTGNTCPLSHKLRGRTLQDRERTMNRLAHILLGLCGQRLGEEQEHQQSSSFHP